MTDLKQRIQKEVISQLRSKSQSILNARSLSHGDLAKKIYQFETKVTALITEILDQITISTLTQIRTLVQPIIAGVSDEQELIAKLNQNSAFQAHKQDIAQRMKKLRERLTDRQTYIKALLSAKYPEFHILGLIEEDESTSISQLIESSKLSRSKISKHLKGLMREGYIRIEKFGRVKTITFQNAPWNDPDEMQYV